MKAIRTHVADVHKDIIVISVLVIVHQFECSTFTDDLMNLRYGVKELVRVNLLETTL
jgi:hypothetical protein